MHCQHYAYYYNFQNHLMVMVKMMVLNDECN
jgi:hypothetical protein